MYNILLPRECRPGGGAEKGPGAAEVSKFIEKTAKFIVDAHGAWNVV